MQCGDYTYRVIDTGAEIMECYGQGGAINLPETLDSLPVVSVGLCAFIMRTDLTAVTLPKTLRHIGGSAFEGCSALTSITLNDGLETIEYRAFASCTALREIAFPDSVTAVGGAVLSGCTALNSVHLPNALTVLPMQALMNCTSLEFLNLPDTLIRIDHALTGCSRLNALTLPAPFSAYARDLRVGLGLMTEGDTLIVGSYLGQAEKGSTYSVIEYIGSDTELIIPAFIEGCRVTKFNQRILEDMDSLRILSVPTGFVVEPTLVPEGAQVVVRPQV